MFTLESNVPIAAAPRGRKATTFPLADMEIGQSFVMAIEGEGKEATKNLESWRRKVRIAIKAFVAEFDAKFQMAKTPDGLRVWRIA